jgi:DNA-binding SARP family transcriptional activator
MEKWTESPECVRIQILGGLRVLRGDVELDVGPRQQRCMLALFAGRVNTSIDITELIALLWADDPPASAVNVIQKYIGILRRLLEPELKVRSQGSWLVRQGSGYRLTVNDDQLDLTRFRRHVQAARKALGKGQANDALDEYLRGLSLWHGRPGEGLAESTTAAAVFSALESEFFEATIEAAGLAVRQGRPARVLAVLRRATALEPLNEPLHAALVRTLAAAGLQAEALAVVRAVRNRLVDELGIEPGADLHEAQRQLLTQSVPVGMSYVAETEAGTGSSVRHLGGTPPDSSRPACPTPLVKPAQLPPNLPTFTGRDLELSTLTKLFDDRRPAARTSPLIVAMDGMSGVGTSTLALHFACRIADQLADGQLYLDLRGQEPEPLPTSDALRSLLLALGVSAAQIPDTFDSLIGMYRSLTADKSFVVLLDNARDAAQVRPLLPNASQSVILITARTPLVRLAIYDGAHLLHIEAPGLSDVELLLEKRLPALPADSHTKLVQEIIAQCGRLPLALATMAAEINARPQKRAIDIVAELAETRTRSHSSSGQ